MIKKFLLLFVLGNGLTDNVLDFRIDYKPNSTYESTTVMSLNGEMDFFGNPDVVNEIRKKVELPMKLYTFSKTFQTIETFEEQNGQTRLEMSTKTLDRKNKLNGQDQESGPNPLEDLVFKGVFENDQIVINDIEGGEEYQELLAIIKEAFIKQANNFILPPRKITVGEKFEHKVPFAIPIPNAPAQVDLVSEYTLQSFTEEKATFLIKTDVKLSSEAELFNIEAGGTGSGKMIFNVNDQFIEMMEQKNDMLFTISSDEINIKSKMKVKTLMVTELI